MHLYLLLKLLKLFPSILIKLSLFNDTYFVLISNNVSFEINKFNEFEHL